MLELQPERIDELVATAKQQFAAYEKREKYDDDEAATIADIVHVKVDDMHRYLRGELPSVPNTSFSDPARVWKAELRPWNFKTAKLHLL